MPWHNTRLSSTFRQSVWDCSIALAIGLPLGLVAGVRHWRLRNGTWAGLPRYVMWLLPWLVPSAALGIAIALLARYVGIKPGILVVSLCHAMFVAPIAAAIGRARLSRLSSEDIFLADVLGINRIAALVRLGARELAIAACLTALVGVGVVLTEVSLAELLCGLDETLPVMLRGMSRSGGTPLIDVIGTVLVFGATGFVLLVWCAASSRRLRGLL